ncbi:protein-disulfide reductase DsbD domain-containing protein [Salinisphaera sp.]|uniref:protein-disulfide reductase DsbD domain-containing protein n=1 Tax=Salinisphaera sp. TaxID=1914330 RepID=UPI0025F9CACA|nr:protein-disulfide reductase DsbD domain-containing protein [Salinisphaera sp.]
MSTSKTFVLTWLLPTFIAIVISGSFLFWQWTVPTTESDEQSLTSPSAADKRDSKRDVVDFYAASESSVAAQSDPARTRQFSAAHVNLQASREADTIKIELEIDSGWHINANPASFDFLIPTEIEVLAGRRMLSTKFAYPSGDELDVGLEEPIRVYSGDVDLTTTLEEAASGYKHTVQAVVQACNDSGLCLPPSTITTSIPDTMDSSLP